MALTEGQQRCVNTLDRSLVVAAGAGSGKTFTLTKRIVGALQSGFLSDIDEVCAITFTKKAAAELKSRLKGELRACGLIGQALKVDEAWVSTIHGMCARILRAHAIELGIAPAFSVVEGARVQEYLDLAVDMVLAEAQHDVSSQRIDALFAEYQARSTGFGVSIEGMLGQLVSAAASQERGADAFVLPGVSLKPHFAVGAAVDAVEEVFALAADQKASAKRDAWMMETEALLEQARDVLERGVDDYGEDHVIGYDSYTLVFQALQNGQVDCIVLDDAVGEAYVAELPGLEILETAYALEDYAFGVDKSNTALTEAVNGALNELIADGTVASIIDSYIGE